jgi:hypothetical protein
MNFAVRLEGNGTISIELELVEPIRAFGQLVRAE